MLGFFPGFSAFLFIEAKKTRCNRHFLAFRALQRASNRL
jgi:hypothetical protein